MATKKILIVDDEETSRKIIKKTLSSEGHELREAKSSQEALTQAKELLPDLILMDILLPDRDGAETVQLIKEYPWARNIKVIFISSLIEKLDEAVTETKSSLKVGNYFYTAFAKPFRIQELLKEVREILKN
jgi:two-component system, OmpR family, alkaline phosphatase synthesis response regulator PhoP